MTEVTREHLDALALPFAHADVEFRPGATNQAKDRALGLAYADPRLYQQRLDEVFGPAWSTRYIPLSTDGSRVICELSIGYTTRSDVGESDPKDPNSATIAAAQAFKRACAAWGLGRYLYSLPQVWAEYDKDRKVFTPAGLGSLRETLRKSLGASVQPKAPAYAATAIAPHNAPAEAVGNSPKATPATLTKIRNAGGAKWDATREAKAAQWASNGRTQDLAQLTEDEAVSVFLQISTAQAVTGTN